MTIVETTRSFALRASDYLQEIDYRIALEPQDRDEIFRLRYRAYLREKTILPNDTSRFTDAYDSMDNCWIFGLWEGERILSSVRLHVISKASRHGPALDVFPDLVSPMVERGMVLIDPTRFVADELAQQEYAALPYLTLRAACMASEYFGADYCLATVRREHCAFYRRVFEAEQLCEPRPYPTLLQPIALMRADVRSIRDRLMERYPVFLSSLTERRMMFAPMPLAGLRSVAQTMTDLEADISVATELPPPSATIN
jgi:N-acyl-L-homoserine lactone synthetase